MFRLGVVPVGEVRWWNEGWHDLAVRREANEFGQSCRVEFWRFRIVDQRCAANDPRLGAYPGPAKLGRASQRLRAGEANCPHVVLDARSSNQPGSEAPGLDDYLPTIAETHAEHPRCEACLEKHLFNRRIQPTLAPLAELRRDLVRRHRSQYGASFFALASDAGPM